MSRKALRAFFAEQIEAAKRRACCLTARKATMIEDRRSHRVRHAVSSFRRCDREARRYAEASQRQSNNGFGDLLTKIETLPEAEKKAIKDESRAATAKRPGLAMVNSYKGITGLHVPATSSYAFGAADSASPAHVGP